MEGWVSLPPWDRALVDAEDSKKAQHYALKVVTLERVIE
jgi:hypothetical protein